MNVVLKQLKILYFTIDLSNYFQQSNENFKEELRKNQDIDVYFHHGSGDIQEILNKINFQPDFIFIDEIELFRLSFGFPTGLNNIDIPTGVLIHDLHRDNHLYTRFILENEIDLVFTFYRDAFLHLYPQLADKMVWLPASINPNIFKDYGLEKKIDFLMMGAKVRKWYPLRSIIHEEMKNKPGYVYHGHPGYRNLNEEERKRFLVGEKYAREINRAKIFFTCDLIYKYPVKKYFEVTACNTLLLASGSKELKDLGFIHGETFIEINSKDVRQKANYYLYNEAERLAIAKRGHEMVMKNHTMEKRAVEFIEHLKKHIHWSDKTHE